MDQLAYVQVGWIFLHWPLAVDMDPTVPTCLELLGHVWFGLKWITMVISDHYVRDVPFYSRMSRSLKYIRHNCLAVTVKIITTTLSSISTSHQDDDFEYMYVMFLWLLLMMMKVLIKVACHPSVWDALYGGRVSLQTDSSFSRIKGRTAAARLSGFTGRNLIWAWWSDPSTTHTHTHTDWPSRLCFTSAGLHLLS